MPRCNFAHKEGESTNATIDRFDVAINYCRDQDVNVDDNHAKRMPSARLDDIY